MTGKAQSETNATAAFWREACKIAPDLRRLEKLAAAATDQSLKSVDGWLVGFVRLMDRHPRLAEHRRSIFAHLLAVHNGAEAVK